MFGAVLRREAPRLLLIAALSGGVPVAWANPPDYAADSGAQEAVSTAGNSDPWEPFNRAVYRFNTSVDRAVLRPLARGYVRVAPEPVRRSVTNFFDNLGMPIDVVNSLLQGKVRKSAVGTGRFLVNSTAGVLGLFDVATKMGLEPGNEDLGQTLAVWGIQDGPYLVLPLFGPSTVRDGVGLVGDAWLHPLSHVEDDAVRYSALALRIVNTRANLLSLDRMVETAFDPYLFVREAYLQRREFLIHDGDPPGVDYYDVEPPGEEGPAPADP